MYLFITILAVIAAVILTILVLAQNSKGGGLASSFASSNQIMGVRKTTDFVEKATWGFAAAIIVLSVAATFAMRDVTTSNEPKVKTDATEAFQTDPNLVTPDLEEPIQ